MFVENGEIWQLPSELRGKSTASLAPKKLLYLQKAAASLKVGPRQISERAQVAVLQSHGWRVSGLDRRVRGRPLDSPSESIWAWAMLLLQL